MFAPHCPNCQHRVLLGTGRIVRFAWDRHGERRIIVRCFCGTLLDALPLLWGDEPDQPDELPMGA